MKIERLLQIFWRQMPVFRAISTENTEIHDGSETYWPCGVRCRRGVNLVWAFVRNLRTWLVMIREKAQAAEP